MTSKIEQLKANMLNPQNERLNNGERTVGPRETANSNNAHLALNKVKKYEKSVDGAQQSRIKNRMDRRVPRSQFDNLVERVTGTVRTVTPRKVNSTTNNYGRSLEKLIKGAGRAKLRIKNAYDPVEDTIKKSKNAVRKIRQEMNNYTTSNNYNEKIKKIVTDLPKNRNKILEDKVKKNESFDLDADRIRRLDRMGLASNEMVGYASELERRKNAGMLSAPKRHGKYFVTRNLTSRKKVRAIDIDSEIAGYLAMPIHLDEAKIRAVGVAHMNQSVPLNFGRPQPSIRNKRNNDTTYLTEDLDNIMTRFLLLYMSGESHSKLKSRSLLFSVFAQSMKDYMAICRDAVVECRKALRPVRREYHSYDPDNLVSAAASEVAREIRNKISETGVSRADPLKDKLIKMGATIPSNAACEDKTKSKIFLFDGSITCVSPGMLSPLPSEYNDAKKRLRIENAEKFAKVTRNTDKNVVAIRSLYGDVLIKRNILLYTYLDSLSDTLLHRNPNVRLNPLVREYMVMRYEGNNHKNAFRLRFEKYGGWIQSSMRKGPSYKYSEPDIREQYWRPSLRSFGKKGINMYWIQFLREIYDWKRVSNVSSVASQIRTSSPNTFKANNDPSSLNFRASLRDINSRLGKNLGVTEYGYTITTTQLKNPMNVVPWTPSYHRFGRSWYVSDYSESDSLQLPFGGYNEYSAPPSEQSEQGLSGEALDVYLNMALTNVCQVEKGSKGRYTHITTGGIGNMPPGRALTTFSKLRLYSVGSHTLSAPLVWNEENILTPEKPQNINWMGPSLQWSILNAAGLVAGTRHPGWRDVMKEVQDGRHDSPFINADQVMNKSRVIEKASAQMYFNNISNKNKSITVSYYPSDILNKKYKVEGSSFLKITRGSKPKNIFYADPRQQKIKNRDLRLRTNREFQKSARITAHNVGQIGLNKVGYGLCADPRARCKNVRTNENNKNRSHEQDKKSLADAVFMIDSQIFCDVDDDQAFYAHFAGNSTITDAAYTKNSNRVPCRLPVDTTKRGGRTLLQSGKRGVEMLQSDAESGIAGLMERMKENVLMPLFYGNQIISYYHFDDLMKRFLKNTAPLQRNGRTSAAQLNTLLDRPDMSDLMESLQYYLLLYIGESPSNAARKVVQLTRFRKFDQNELAKYDTARMLRVLGERGIMSKPAFTKVISQLIVSRDRKDGLTLMQVDAEIARLREQINERPKFFEEIKRSIAKGLGITRTAESLGIIKSREFETKLTKQNSNMGLGKFTAGGIISSKLRNDTSNSGQRKAGLTKLSDREIYKKINSKRSGVLG